MMEVITVIDPAIEAFFAERKEAWLKKNMSTAMDEQQLREKQQECEQNFSLSNWLPDAAKRAGQISISSHPCTFSHPSARKNKNGYVSSVIAKNRSQADGFLRSGNVSVEVDALGNAAALDVYKFLSLEMADRRSLLTHIEQGSELAQGLLTQPNTDYQTLREGFLKMIDTDQEAISSSKVKQVYFPVAEGEYHLLSLLTHSGHLFKLRQRLDALRFGEEVKQARECRKNGQFYPDGYQEIFGLTTIGFGGTKPQNISVLNNKNAGKAHLLASTPPELKPRNLRLPTTDFFKESFTAWQAKETLEALHRLFKTDYNNINIRDGRDYRIQEYVDLVIHKMWQVRLFLADYQGDLSSDLKPEQKFWLYPEYEQYRLEENEWLEGIIRQISRSLIFNYSKVTNNSTALADDELLAIERVVRDNKEALR
ncbi:type I-F CRISPR-associated protein Csy1 [Vibrio parahaemolyticus]|uniref:type I-F CRISPR-associated protein Csy1 n=2 Tax=Vibrio parahaemolyticus TaxID=670 RepID=UPI001FCC4520|nr:type I-F CRISPR-associated protein Csy1 [Vibrio parahaemolyticus]MCI4892499.1 type I-F CRISPR-associated protein Csy1 [Vibrio parahaemolyticus]MCR9789544.1 type I-F CRISPR-associated protein Csy1 [Vibrio parahaemolyticus]MCR9829343.1 type I-F CRISPR-associated protein Csy1 [Vibrio parahaemolyticus]MDF4959447.1 type I-F CRISPR-associated protein Csy1 [Vibrio parahaemolyticus]MDF5176083.1 type I-F CRISPR-associated protein Csy1 [Vibrio parahaemolyticus]